MERPAIHDPTPLPSGPDTSLSKKPRPELSSCGNRNVRKLTETVTARLRARARLRLATHTAAIATAAHAATATSGGDAADAVGRGGHVEHASSMHQCPCRLDFAAAGANAAARGGVARDDHCALLGVPDERRERAREERRRRPQPGLRRGLQPV